jgi:hypothetical protein
MHLALPTSPAHVAGSSDIMKKEFFSILLGQRLRHRGCFA